MAQEYEKYPDNPVKISKKARKIFRELYRILKASGNWSDGYEYGLSVLSQAYDYYDQCLTELNKDGLFYESKSMRRKHPAFELMGEQVKTIKELSVQFKLAPRFREKGEAVQNSDDPVRLLINKTKEWQTS